MRQINTSTGTISGDFSQYIINPLKNLFKENIMNKKGKVQFVIDELEKLYPKTPVPLNHHDPFTLLIAVLLSAQCTDERVNKITPILFKKADNPFDMVKLSVEEIKAIIRPCGLSPKKSNRLSNR